MRDDMNLAIHEAGKEAIGVSLCRVLLFFTLTITSLFVSCRDSGIEIDRYMEEFGASQLSTDLVNIVLTTDGTVWTWGANFTGALGNGTNESSDIPRRVYGLDKVISIDQSYGAVVALDKEGGIWFWGNLWIFDGSADGDTNVLSPLRIAHLPGATTITIQSVQVFILGADGDVWSIILDPTSPSIKSGPTALELNLNHSFRTISKDLGVSVDGKVFRLGLSSSEISGLESMTQTVRGIDHFLSLRDDSVVVAWGSNELGQLGDGTTESRYVALPVQGIGKASQISAAYNLSLAVVAGEVWVWGYGGTLTDSTIIRVTPIKVAALNNVVLACVGMNSLVVCKDGSYWTFNYQLLKPERVVIR